METVGSQNLLQTSLLLKMRPMQLSDLTAR